MKAENKAIQKKFDDFVFYLFHEVRVKYRLIQTSHETIHRNLNWDSAALDSGVDIAAIDDKWLKYYVTPIHILPFDRSLRSLDYKYSIGIHLLLKTDEDEVIVTSFECTVKNMTDEKAAALEKYIGMEIRMFGLDNGYYNVMFEQFKYNNPDSLFDFNCMFGDFMAANELKYVDIMLSNIDEVEQLSIVNSYLRLFETYDDSERQVETVAWLLNKQHELIKHLTGADEMKL